MEYCNFLENYRIYTKGNETPELIHLWSGLSALAGACEKRLYIDQEFFQLYLNLYVLLVAPAGVAAKSTSMGLALKMLKEGGYNVLEGSVLKEKIIEDMEELQSTIETIDGHFTHSSVTYVSNELNVMLNSGVDMVKFLVDIFDRGDSYVYKTKKSGQYEVPYPYFNMIAAAVPQWFGEYVGSDMGSTGFLARCIVVYEEQKRGRYPKLIYTDEQKEARARCMEIIHSVGSLYGEVRMTDKADQWYHDWYMSQDPNPSHDYRVNSYFERRNKIHILKVAALMAVGDLRQQIEPIDLERAAHILNKTEKKMRLAYVISGSNKLAPYIHQVISLLEEKKGKIEITELVRILCQDLDVDDIKKLFTTLEDMEEAKRSIIGGKKWLVSMKG